MTMEISYAFTLTINLFFKPPELNVIFALPVTFFAVIVNITFPLESVILLSGEILTHFLPILLILIVTSLSSTRQSPLPVNVTVTL